MRKTTNYELNIAEGSDRYNHLTIDNPNYEKIDTTMKENEDSAVHTATELKNGTVHAITRNKPDAPMFRFVATSDYSVGETFTVDGMQVTALLPNGSTLSTGAYHINANVLCCLVGTNMTVYTIGSTDANTLNGHSADYFATADGLAEVTGIAQSAQVVANNASNKLNNLKFEFVKVWENSNRYWQDRFEFSPVELTPLVLLQYYVNDEDVEGNNFIIAKSGSYNTICFGSNTGTIFRNVGIFDNAVVPSYTKINGNIYNENKYLVPKALYNIKVK